MKGRYITRKNKAGTEGNVQEILCRCRPYLDGSSAHRRVLFYIHTVTLKLFFPHITLQLQNAIYGMRISVCYVVIIIIIIGLLLDFYVKINVLI